MITNDKGQLKFEVKMQMGKGGNLEKAIFIGGELLDWSVDVSVIADASKMGPAMLMAVRKDIAKHFVESVSDFIGRKVTEKEIQLATQTGWI